MRSLARVFALLLAMGVSAAYADALSVTDAWARASIGTATPGVVYLTIHNTGTGDTLTGLSTPAAATASLHESRTKDGVASMAPVSALVIAPGNTVKFAPGGYHVMLEGLTRALKAGDTFPLTLTFAHAGAVTTTVVVRALGDTR